MLEPAALDSGSEWEAYDASPPIRTEVKLAALCLGVRASDLNPLFAQIVFQSGRILGGQVIGTPILVWIAFWRHTQSRRVSMRHDAAIWEHDLLP